MDMDERINALREEYLESLKPKWNKEHELLLHHSWYSVHLKDIQSALSIIATTKGLLNNTFHDEDDKKDLNLKRKLHRDSIKMALTLVSQVREQAGDEMEFKDNELCDILHKEDEERTE